MVSESMHSYQIEHGRLTGHSSFNIEELIHTYAGRYFIGFGLENRSQHTIIGVFEEPTVGAVYLKYSPKMEAYRILGESFGVGILPVLNDIARTLDISLTQVADLEPEDVKWPSPNMSLARLMYRHSLLTAQIPITKRTLREYAKMRGINPQEYDRHVHQVKIPSPEDKPIDEIRSEAKLALFRVIEPGTVAIYKYRFMPKLETEGDKSISYMRGVTLIRKPKKRRQNL